MSDPPRGASEPPPRGDGDGARSRGSRPPRVERAMSIPLAIAWVFGITLQFIWLVNVIVSLRPGAQHDLVSAFGCQAVAYLAGLVAILQVHAPRASIREFLGIRATSPLFYPIAIALGVAIEGPISAIYQVIERRWPSPGDGEAEIVRILAEAGTAERIVLGAILIALGPALEEVFFRGALMRPLRQRHGAATVVATTAALFAIAHVEPQKFAPIALFAIALGVLRIASGSLLPGIVLHATYNAIPFYAILSRGGEAAGGAASGGGELTPPWLAATSAAALALTALAYAVGLRSESAARAREKDKP